MNYSSSSKNAKVYGWEFALRMRYQFSSLVPLHSHFLQSACNEYMHHNKKAPILFGISVMNRKNWNANLLYCRCTLPVPYFISSKTISFRTLILQYDATCLSTYFDYKNSPSAHLNCTLPVFLLICMKIIFPLRKFFDLYQAILEGLIYLTDVNLDDINAKDYDKYKNY